MTNNNIMGVRKVITYPDLRIAIICLSRVSCSFLGRHFCYILILILTVSVSVIDVQIHNKPIKALLRPSDALKCTDLSNSKVKEKSCVRGQIF